MAFFEDEGGAARLQRFTVAFEHGRCRAGGIDGEIMLVLGEDRARDQPNEIDRIGHVGDLVEIIDAPNEAALGVAPRPEILHMQIAHGQYRGGLDEVRADLGP